MVQAVRQGASMRQVADLFGVALATVQRWVQRAQGQRLDRVDWTDRPCGLPTSVNRTERQREDLVLTLRQQLRATSDLGEFGAAAIHREWRARPWPCPARPRPAPPAWSGSGAAPSTAGGAFAALHRLRAGTCRRSPTAVPSWTASTPSRGW